PGRRPGVPPPLHGAAGPAGVRRRHHRAQRPQRRPRLHAGEEERRDQPGPHRVGAGHVPLDRLNGRVTSRIDKAALAAGTIRLTSGISFLVDPVRANRMWGDKEDPVTTTRLLLRSMGYRDALIGGLLVSAALRGRNTRGWFLASGGADASDLLGGMSVHSQMKKSQQIIGLGGAVVGIGVGLWGATRRRGDSAAAQEAR